MAKLTLQSISAGFGSTSLLNANFDAIEEALENTLSRDGTGPNQMEAELDMNSNKITNLAAPTTSSDAARLKDIEDAANTDLTVRTASLTSLTDTAGIYDSDNVEGALAEVGPTVVKTGVVAGVIRYYAATGDWEFISEQQPAPPGSSHITIGCSSVTANSQFIEVTLDASALGGVGTYDIASFVVGPDEDLAREGVICGASVNSDTVDIYTYKDGYSEYVRYNGTEWITSFDRFTARWATDHLIIERPLGGVDEAGFCPMLTPRETPYHVTIGTFGTGTGGVPPGFTGIHVWFYDASGTLVTTPDTNMKFFVYDPSVKVQLNPLTDFTDSYGNLWVYGVVRKVV